jgi:hypothetical protein
MNVSKDIFEIKWGQIRAQTQAWWSLFSYDDLEKVDKAPVKRDRYTLMLRVKYGYSHERALDEIGKRITDVEAHPASPQFIQDSLTRQASAKVSKVRKQRTKNSVL